MPASSICAAIYYGDGIAAFLDKAGEQGRPVMFHFADPDAAAFDRLRTRFPAVEVFFYRGVAPGFAEAGQGSTSRPSISPIPARWSCSAACSGRATTSTRSGTATPSSNSSTRDADETMTHHGRPSLTSTTCRR